ncbi:MAG: hypothetical protein HY049_13890 [Acidobacteria bacterium]|nr:hypothetical protein [Acidobacteriota bacterium]
MKLAVIALLAIALGTAAAHAAAAKTYQVTGPVLSVTADTIVVQKGEDKWEISRDAATKVTGDLAVGSQVTIQYRMSAVSVEVKAPKGEAKAPAKSKSKS